MKRNSLLVVHENKRDLISFIQYLDQEGFQTTAIENSREVKGILTNSTPDLIMIPIDYDAAGRFNLCQFIKSNKQTADTLVVMLSNRKEEFNLLKGLDSGADDFVFQPIQERLLLSRLKALLRRKKRENIFHNQENLIIDRDRYLIVKNGKNYYLPKKEFEILSLLFSQPNKVFSRDEIKNTIWENFDQVRRRTVDVHIRKIREKIGEGLIATVKGVGYRINEASY